LSQQLSDNIKEERLEGKLDLRDGISSMAGPDAEAMLIGERDEKAQEGALTDIIRITNSCRVAAEPGVPLEKLTHCEMENNIIQALSIQAIDLLKKNWTAVEAVAKELMKREYLSYSEVVELVNQAAPMAAKD
jgi:hypothetical protein